MFYPAILKYMLNYYGASNSGNSGSFNPPSLDLVFHALADPGRRRMVERLSRGPASVSELAKPLTMSLPAVVQHLQVLEGSGLVISEKVGRVRTCRLNTAVLKSAEEWINERRQGWERKLDRLGDFLAADVDDEPDELSPPDTV
jgi:DNA-binding transcriptional ArsR family regulator